MLSGNTSPLFRYRHRHSFSQRQRDRPRHFTDSIQNLTLGNNLALSKLLHAEEMAQLRSVQCVNQEQLAQLTAGLVELRTLISDYIQGRSQIQGE
jgi:hypothetical protein